jgi:hypothetical protein
MLQRFLLVIGVTVVAAGAAVAEGVPAKPDVAGQPKVAPSRVVAVTVYQDSALVTREVDVPEGAGSVELVVSPLPEQTVNSSLYSEGSDSLRILTTRFRTRPILEDTREEVRKAEAEFKQLRLDAEKLQSEAAVIQQNLQMLAKLENFTSANLQHQTEKGTLNSEAIMALAKYVMEQRAEKSQTQVSLQDKLRTNQEQQEFTQRRLRDLAAGSTKTERDAVIIVDKKEPVAGKIRLNYLVNSASWHPQYKFRAGKEKDPVQVEYLAAVVQQTGEDWSNVKLVLSTAQPMLNSAPPDLKMLEVAVLPRGAGNPMAVLPGNPGGFPGQSAAGAGQPPPAAPQTAAEFDKQAQALRQEGQRFYNEKKGASADILVNSAGAVDQAKELLVTKEEDVKKGRIIHSGGGEGPSITYHLATKLAIPSRKDEQVIEVAKLEMAPEYYYKAVPVLTAHVYRLANLTNKSEYVLLPGEATMYIGKDFVGRSELPLVAIGEQFTAGFGVDPQLQVQRQMTDKTRTMQGDNQILKFEYRILISSYKAEPVKVQLWDRLPHAETEAVGVNLVKAEPEISTDALYLRENRPNNLLRWDLTVEPTMNGEKAKPIKYEFKLELGRQMMIGNFQTK